MKILHTFSDTKPESGGPVEAFLRATEVLLRDGHEIEVASMDPEEEVARRKFPFLVTALGKGVGKYGYNPRFTKWVKHNAARFDVVILHGLWNYSSLGSWLALRECSTPYYIFTHGMMDPWFRDRYPLKHIAKQLFWWAGEGRVLRDAKGVLFTSDEERLRARDVFHGFSYREEVVLYGTAGPDDSAERQKCAFGRAFQALKDRRFLLFLSRIHPKKGCDLLIRAFAENIPQLPRNVDLAFAGPDQVGWVAKLRALVDDLGLAGRVHWLGMLQGDLKWGAFRSAEAMILPSHQENFGIVVAEAMSCGLPVLISDKINIWREVESSGGGRVQSDTIEGTSEQIRSFYKLSPEARQRMAGAARQGFLRYFDIEVTARDLVRVISS